MSYTKIKLNDKTPDLVKKFIEEYVEMMFQDVHCMLRLPLECIGLDAGMNFSVMNCLADLISGFSALLTPKFNTHGCSDKKFKEILTNYYPWDKQPPNGDTKERAIEDIYNYFRNPLSHSLGLNTNGNYQKAISKATLSESEIENLETSDKPPGSAISYLPVTINNENIQRIEVNVAHFYWGIRQTLINLSADQQKMQDFANNLKREGYR